MDGKRWLLVLLLLIGFKSFGQSYQYTYTDPCTGIPNTVTITQPLGSVTLFYAGQWQTFTAAQLQAGGYEVWVASINAQFPPGSNPCAGAGAQTSTSSNSSTASNTAMNVSSIVGIAASLGSQTSSTTITPPSGGTSTGGSNDNSNNSGGSGSSTGTNNGGNSSGSSTSGGTSGSGSGSSSNGGNSGNGGSSGSSSGSSSGGSSTGGSGSSGSSGGSSGSSGGGNTGGSSGGSSGSSGSGGGGTGGSGEPSGGVSGTDGGGVSSGGTDSGSGTSEGAVGGTDNTTTASGGDAEGGDDGGGGGSGGAKKKSKQEKIGRGALIGAGDFVVIRNGSDYKAQGNDNFKFNMSLTHVNTKQTFIKGINFNYTTGENVLNSTLYGSYKQDGFMGVFSNSTMTNFKTDVFNTTTAMVTQKLWIVTPMLGTNFTFGKIGTSDFQNWSIIAGGFTNFNNDWFLNGNVMLLGIYSPYIFYYEGQWYKSGLLFVPLANLDIKLTDTFKWSLSFGGAYQWKADILNFQISTGTKILL